MGMEERLIRSFRPFKVFGPMILAKLRQTPRAGLFLLMILCAAGSARAAEDVLRHFVVPRVAPASNEGELAMKGFVLAPGFKVELFAAEPDLANPVAFTVDEQGRFYVAETFRLHAGVTDIRGHMDWLDEDLAARTADDRLALMKRHEGERFGEYEKYSERVKQIVDLNGDGRADRSTVFAEGFNSALDGIGAGLLARDGKVWFANIPNLWLLQDKDSDGKADTRKSLSYGYGVRVGFLGHDLHGLIMGPDGKIYFSIGDRGSAIQQNGKTVGNPDTGCVFRCNPDGLELEVFATGLRNPQELAFDQYGNLFTGDNNSDGGDKARIVYLAEGSDSGWRVGFQFLERPNSRGPWNSEKMWYPQWEGQAAFIVPPLANLADGPSGFAYYPGTGLPDKYKSHFFLVDFKGGKGSGIHSFALKPKGAGFEVVEREHFVWDCLPTDVGFGIEPGIYFTDWVQGWDMTGKGRIYHVFNADAAKQPIAGETKRLIMGGVHARNMNDLGKLLAHADMRVRQEAQFELAERGEKGLDVFRSVAHKSSSQLARLHAIWGVGEIAAKSSPARRMEIAGLMADLLRDKDSEVRAQSAQFMGNHRAKAATPDLISMLVDSSPRARLFASIALGKIGAEEALPAVFNLLRDNADKDPLVRHGAVMALVGINNVDALIAASRDSSQAVRMCALLALRRLERAEIAVFLKDKSPAIVTEAARAINDIPISGAMPELAALGDKVASQTAEQMPPELFRRIVNANYRYGIRESALRLGKLAANISMPAFIRAEAVSDLSNWVNPSGRDNVTGLWRPAVGARDESHAVEALKPVIASLLQHPSGPVQVAAARAVARLKIREGAGPIVDLIKNSSAPANARVEGLKALAALNDARLAEVLPVAQNDANEELRKEALRLHTQIKPNNAIGQITAALENGTIGEKQSALGTLANVPDSAGDELIAAWMDKLIAGKAPKELALDIYEAAAKRKAPAVKAKMEQYESSLSKSDPLAPFRLSLAGGNAEEGRKIFLERPEAACVRCHKIKGEGGEVGPDLSTIGSRQPREYILESIVLPNKTIAQGFETLIVSIKEGTAYAGIVKSEDNKNLVLNSPEDGIVTIAKDKIEKRDRGISAMPEGIAAVLSKQDLRDLVEYLSSLK
jgi:quinoprotein glucose dehydrogenase